MKKLFYILISLSTASICNAQLSNYTLNDEMAIRVFTSQGYVKNSWSAKTTEDKVSSIWTIHVGFSKSNFEKGKVQRSHRLPLVGDALLPALISPIVDNDAINADIGAPILTSILGWHNFAYAFVSNDRYQIAGGMHIGDYFYGINPVVSERRDERNVDGSSYWYFTLGPSIIEDFDIGMGLMLHYEGAYAFTFGAEPFDLEKDRKPALLNQTLELRWKRFFFNIELVNGLNTWGNRLNRTQFGIGLGF